MFGECKSIVNSDFFKKKKWPLVYIYELTRFGKKMVKLHNLYIS
jgi:hypothetical protein